MITSKHITLTITIGLGIGIVLKVAVRHRNPKNPNDSQPLGEAALNLKTRARSIFTWAAGRSPGSRRARASIHFTKRHPPPQYRIGLLYNTTDEERFVLDVEKHNTTSQIFFFIRTTPE